MSVNVGIVDRYVRLVVGVTLVAWALAFIPTIAPSPWGWIGLIPPVTSLAGYCPVYALFGVNTRGRS
jgi:Protein of unknown function (DUF2892)